MPREPVTDPVWYEDRNGPYSIASLAVYVARERQKEDENSEKPSKDREPCLSFNSDLASTTPLGKDGRK